MQSPAIIQVESRWSLAGKADAIERPDATAALDQFEVVAINRNGEYLTEVIGPSRASKPSGPSTAKRTASLITFE